LNSNNLNSNNKLFLYLKNDFLYVMADFALNTVVKPRMFWFTTLSIQVILNARSKDIKGLDAMTPYIFFEIYF
jgi:hypothetical protein